MSTYHPTGEKPTDRNATLDDYTPTPTADAIEALVEDTIARVRESPCVVGHPRCDGPDGDGLPCWPCFRAGSVDE